MTFYSWGGPEHVLYGRTHWTCLPNMSLYYSFHFRGQSCRLSGKFFQKLFQTSQAGIDRTSNSALMDALRFCNI